MKYQKKWVANLLIDELNKPSKFKTRNWAEINDKARGTYSLIYVHTLINKLNLKQQC